MSETTPTDVVETELQSWRIRMLNALLVAVSIGGAFVVAVTIISARGDPKQLPALLAFIGGYLFLVVIAVFRNLNPRLRMWGLFVVGYLIGTLAFVRGGLAGDGPMYLLALPILAVLLLGGRSGLVMFALSLITFALLAVAAHRGWLATLIITQNDPLPLVNWIDKGTDFTMLSVGLVTLQWLFAHSQNRALRLSKEREAELNETRVLLEEQVREVKRQARQFEAIARVSRDTTELLNLEEILQRTVKSIQEQFDFSIVAVYLAGESESEVGLRAIAGATPEVGKRPAMMEVVNRMMHKKAPRVVRSAEHLGWLVLLLQARGRAIGVLAVQAHVAEREEQGAFDDEDVAVLQMMADQIAIAVENARLFNETQASLRELNALYHQYASGAWEEYGTVKAEELRYSYGDVTCPIQTWQEVCERVRASGEPITTEVCGDEEAIQSLAVPVNLRGMTIGMLGFHRPAEADAWQPEEIAIVRMVTDRLAMAVENIRLLEEAQQRAARERLVGEISGRLRASLDPDIILKTTVRELGRALGAELASVEIKTPAGDGDGGSGAKSTEGGEA